MKYSTRCKIVDVAGKYMGGYALDTPELSKKHIGKEGVAEEIEKNGYYKIKITLDDGTILYGSECWWKPINEID